MCFPRNNSLIISNGNGMLRIVTGGALVRLRLFLLIMYFLVANFKAKCRTVTKVCKSRKKQV